MEEPRESTNWNTDGNDFEPKDNPNFDNLNEKTEQTKM